MSDKWRRELEAEEIDWWDRDGPFDIAHFCHFLSHQPFCDGLKASYQEHLDETARRNKQVAHIATLTFVYRGLFSEWDGETLKDNLGGNMHCLVEDRNYDNETIWSYLCGLRDFQPLPDNTRDEILAVVLERDICTGLLGLTYIEREAALALGWYNNKYRRRSG